MPHINVKLWPGKSEKQKAELTEAITQAVCNVLQNSEASISISFEEIERLDWMEKVYQPEIIAKASSLYKKPGYTTV